MRSILLVGLVAVLVASGCLRDLSDVERNFVRVRNIDVSAPEVATGTARLLVNVTLDNSGGASEPVHLVVKAYDTGTGLLQVTRTTEGRILERDRSVPFEVDLVVPKTEGVRIRVEVHEGGRIVQEGTVTLRNLAALRPTLHETGLVVSKLDFLVRNVSTSRASIEAQVFITNEGSREPRELRMVVKARDIATRLIADEIEAQVGGVAPEETRAFPVVLNVPTRTNYEVEASLWDGAFVVEEGVGIVQLLPTITRPKDQELVVSEPQLENFVRDERSLGERGLADQLAGGQQDTSDSPGPGALLVVLLVAALAVVVRRRKSHG